MPSSPSSPSATPRATRGRSRSPRSPSSRARTSTPGSPSSRRPGPTRATGQGAVREGRPPPLRATRAEMPTPDPRVRRSCVCIPVGGQRPLRTRPSRPRIAARRPRLRLTIRDPSPRSASSAARTPSVRRAAGPRAGGARPPPGDRPVGRAGRARGGFAPGGARLPPQAAPIGGRRLCWRCARPCREGKPVSVGPPTAPGTGPRRREPSAAGRSGPPGGGPHGTDCGDVRGP